MNNPHTRTLAPLWRNEDRMFVKVDEEKLQEVAEQFRGDELEVPAWDVPNVYPALDCSLEDWLQFLGWSSVINFAFTNFSPPHEKFAVEYPLGEKPKSGGFAMMACLVRAKEEYPLALHPEFMAHMDPDTFDFMFWPYEKEYSMPLAPARHAMLRLAAKVLLDKYSGSWLNLFEKAKWRAFNRGRGIVERLVSEFPHAFRDVRSFNGRELAFHKRAQLFVLMHHGRALHSGGAFPLIEDYERLGPPCDYELPRALESLGVLRYAPQLKQDIAERRTIPENSREEAEIRVATWYAMQRLCELLGTWIGPVDYKVWLLGRKAEAPHHLTQTTAY